MKERRKHTSRPSNEPGQIKAASGKSAYENDRAIKSDDIKDAHASGIGSLARNDEDQIDKLSYGEIGNDEDVY